MVVIYLLYDRDGAPESSDPAESKRVRHEKLRKAQNGSQNESPDGVEGVNGPDSSLFSLQSPQTSLCSCSSSSIPDRSDRSDRSDLPVLFVREFSLPPHSQALRFASAMLSFFRERLDHETDEATAQTILNVVNYFVRVIGSPFLALAFPSLSSVLLVVLDYNVVSTFPFFLAGAVDGAVHRRRVAASPSRPLSIDGRGAVSLRDAPSVPLSLSLASPRLPAAPHPVSLGSLPPLPLALHRRQFPRRLSSPRRRRAPLAPRRRALPRPGPPRPPPRLTAEYQREVSCRELPRPRMALPGLPRGSRCKPPSPLGHGRAHAVCRRADSRGHAAATGRCRNRGYLGNSAAWRWIWRPAR